ncbi:MAG: NADP-dependent isocitrate dehydrogenase [Oscillospiraceae bacterium]|nr:NADP-dependent isocitrate dehydrogenase [Oscillospiraceae bacterium]
MSRIQMKNPVVEMDGDEMTRVIWALIKRDLLEPFVELKTEYYDLGLPHRDETGDAVTHEAAAAIKKYHVGVKCATITPNAQRVEEYNLREMWKSPNGTIRAALDGTVFRTPILTRAVSPVVKGWKKPITIARHAYGDVYRATEYRVPGPGRAELCFTGENGETFRKTVYDYECAGVLQAMFNKDNSIESFARSSFEYALDRGEDLWFSTKDTISKQYDQTFKLIFQRIFDEEYRQRFAEKGIEYFYTLIDDAVARVIRSKGGFIWACKNYDGDVMSDMVSAAFGSLAMMTSVLVSPEGNFEYEAAHGTVTRHWYRYQQGERTSTNPVATVFAWSGALRKRGELDGTPELCAFAHRLEKATLDTIESGVMTKDLALLSEIPVKKTADTEEFISAIAEKL